MQQHHIDEQQLYKQVKEQVFKNTFQNDQLQFEQQIMMHYNNREYSDVINLALRKKQFQKFEYIDICGGMFKQGSYIICTDSDGKVFGGQIIDIYQIGQAPWSQIVFIYIRILILARLFKQQNIQLDLKCNLQDFRDCLDLQEMILTSNYLLIKPKDVCGQIDIYKYYDYSQLDAKYKADDTKFYMRYQISEHNELSLIQRNKNLQCNQCQNIMNMIFKPIICMCKRRYLCHGCQKDFLDQLKGKQIIDKELLWRCKKCFERQYTIMQEIDSQQESSSGSNSDSGNSSLYIND